MREASRDLWRRVVSGGLFPLHERLKGHDTTAVLRRLEASQWQSPERVEEDRLERLRRFLTHAATHVPYYGEQFAEAGFDPQAVRSLSDLGRLPFLDKATIRARFDDLRAPGAKGLRRMSTGGSSGEPLTFLLGNERIAHDVAAKWRATRWWGVDIGDPEIVLWGSPIELGAQDRLRMLRDRMLRSRLLPAFEMSPEKVRGFIEAIRHHRPRMLFGYPSAISHVAAAAEQEGFALDDIGVRVAFVTGETLYDDQRARIGRVFGCHVANGYGGRDAGFVAHECPEGSLHVTAEDVIVEAVDSDGRPLPAGSPGEIVVTHLATSDFPFIRYRTGDVGVLGDERCTCGRGLPVLQEVQGRTTDFVVAQDGTVTHGLALIYVLRDLPQIEGFRIMQESRDRTSVQVVSSAGLTEDTTEHIRSEFMKRLGADVTINIEQVDDLPREASGKFRYVQSRVSGDHGTL